MWIPLTSALLQTKLTAAEFSSISAAQLPSGTTAAELIAQEITSTVAMVRGYVAANRENTLGEGETIPDELRDAALCILRHKTFSRIPGLKKLLDEARVREYEDALAQLKDAAAGRFRVTPPETIATAQPASQTIASRASKRQSTRQSWSGTL
jgi:hypothetical protein